MKINFLKLNSSLFDTWKIVKNREKSANAWINRSCNFQELTSTRSSWSPSASTDTATGLSVAELEISRPTSFAGFVAELLKRLAARWSRLPRNLDFEKPFVFRSDAFNFESAALTFLLLLAALIWSSTTHYNPVPISWLYVAPACS